MGHTYDGGTPTVGGGRGKYQDNYERIFRCTTPNPDSTRPSSGRSRPAASTRTARSAGRSRRAKKASD